MSSRIASRILWGLLAGLIALPAFADDRRFGSQRHRDYGRDGYSLPRQQPVLPTRPFFVQPYPRNDVRQGNQAYRHGYREGYSDGYADRDDRRGRRDRYDRGGYRGDDHRSRWDSGYRSRRNNAYNGGYPGASSYYGPRPGVSIYYENR